MEVLVIDIHGDFGHFRKFYTTTSPLTFSIPPPTSVYGMLGAITGYDKNEYLGYINHESVRLGIQILQPVKKTRMGINLVYVKGPVDFTHIQQRTQIKTEFLRNPTFRLYIHPKNSEIASRLFEKLSNNANHYTVSLGLANLLAKYSFIGKFQATPLHEAVEIHSTILSDHVKNLHPEHGKRYFKEKLPIAMAPDRIVTRYGDVIMELTGKSIKGNFENCYRIDDRIISFLN